MAAGYDVIRYAGATRFETAVEIAVAVVARTGADTALVAYAFNFPDALVGGAYGAAAGVPVLLTDTDALHPAAAAAIDDLGITATSVLGGTAVISGAVMGELPDPQRIAGSNRMATAVAIASELWPAIPAHPDVLVFVDAEAPDAWVLALAAAPLSATAAAPQLGLAADALPDETSAYVTALGADAARALVIGGPGFVPDDVIDGSSRSSEGVSVAGVTRRRSQAAVPAPRRLGGAAGWLRGAAARCSPTPAATPLRGDRPVVPDAAAYCRLLTVDGGVASRGRRQRRPLAQRLRPGRRAHRLIEGVGRLGQGAAKRGPVPNVPTLGGHAGAPPVQPYQELVERPGGATFPAGGTGPCSERGGDYR